MRRVSILLALAGLALATLVVLWFGAGRVLAAAAQAGWAGFGLFVLCQAGLFVVLAWAWLMLLPGVRLPVTLAGRMVRDAATNCLPFSHLGGVVLGARAARLAGLPWGLAAASLVVDVTAEFFAQVGFALFGLAALVARRPHSPLAWPIVAGVLFSCVCVGGFVVVQRRAGKLFRVVGGRIVSGWEDRAAAGGAAIETAFTALYAAPGRLALCTATHLVAWCGSGLTTWVGYHLLGANVAVLDAMAIEALVNAVLMFSFLVPGNLGVQEAAFAVIGQSFGIPADLSVGLSLLRRARDVAIGVPILLAYQFVEARSLRIARPVD